MTKVRSHDDLQMRGRGEIWISADPRRVYEAIADLPRMGEWSPENCGGEWIGAPGLALGASFRGWNRAPHAEWETVATIVHHDPPRSFAFRVASPGEPGTTWRYAFVPERDGTLVTEEFEWQWTPLPAEGFRGRVGRMPLSEAIDAVREREQHLQAQIERTLTSMKLVLEAGSELRGRW